MHTKHAHALSYERLYQWSWPCTIFFLLLSIQKLDLMASLKAFKKMHMPWITNHDKVHPVSGHSKLCKSQYRIWRSRPSLVIWNEFKTIHNRFKYWPYNIHPENVTYDILDIHCTDSSFYEHKSCKYEMLFLSDEVEWLSKVYFALYSPNRIHHCPMFNEVLYDLDWLVRDLRLPKVKEIIQNA